MAAGEGYGEHKEEKLTIMDREKLPPFGIAIAPIILVIASNYIFSKFIFQDMDASYLEQYGTTLSKVIGDWSLIVSLIIGVLVAIICNYKRMGSVVEVLKEGVAGSFLRCE